MGRYRAIEEANRQANEELYWPPPKTGQNKEQSMDYNMEEEIDRFLAHMHGKTLCKAQLLPLLQNAVKATEEGCRKRQLEKDHGDILNQDAGRRGYGA